MTISKSAAAKLIAQGLAHESFEHEYLGHFNVTLINQAIIAKRIPFLCCEAVIDDRVRYIIRECRDIDAARVSELTPEQLDTPCLVIHDPADNTDTIIDGTHRLAGKIARGDTHFRFFRINVADAIRVDEEKLVAEYGTPNFVKRNSGKDHSAAPKHDWEAAIAAKKEERKP